MAKFHVDPAGNPGVCRATKRCPYGSLTDDHFPSEESARRSYELENSSDTLEFGIAEKNILKSIGPRQLPNRAWSSVNSALARDRFSEHDLHIAFTAVSEEWEKLSAIASTSPYQWGEEERTAVNGISQIAPLASMISRRLERMKKERLAQVEKEFNL